MEMEKNLTETEGMSPEELQRAQDLLLQKSKEFAAERGRELTGEELLRVRDGAMAEIKSERPGSRPEGAAERLCPTCHEPLTVIEPEQQSKQLEVLVCMNSRCPKAGTQFPSKFFEGRN